MGLSSVEGFGMGLAPPTAVELARGGGAHAEAQRFGAPLAFEVSVDLDEVRTHPALPPTAGRHVHPSAEFELAVELSGHVQVPARHAAGNGGTRREDGQILMRNHHDNDLPNEKIPMLVRSGPPRLVP